MLRRLLILVIALRLTSIFMSDVIADEPILPPGDTSPLLRLETNGPRSYVSGLAFSPDGQHVYATGWDKAVQVWNLQNDGKYEYSSGATLRVPTGAGPFGVLNGLALSSNGKWLATAGQGQPREVPGERSFGWVLPAGNISETSQLDNGMIYVFNTLTRTTTLLRGHRGPVQALAFVKNSASDAPELVSIAEEHIDGTSDLVCRVRVWDILKAREVASLSSVPDLEGKNWVPLPGLNGFRPGVSAWSTGPDSKQARVALAWGDDQFRVWDVQTGQVANFKSNPNILAVLPLTAKGEQIVTGAHAEIGLWSLPMGDKGQLGAFTRQNFQLAPIDSVSGRSQNLANAVALIPAKNGIPDQLVFVVTRYLPNGRGEYRLVISNAKSPMKTVKEVELSWRGEIRQPSIAVSTDGKKLALSGNERHEIEIYLLDDLLAGRTVPSQVLGSVGMSLKDAMFVRSGEFWGLQLADSKRDATGRFPSDSLVFDIQQRKIEKVSKNWQPAIPNTEGWSAEFGAVAGAIRVKKPGKTVLELKLEKDHVVTAYAFCPASPHCPVSLVAIASQVRGQPLLQIYNGETSDCLRWCVGHTERVRSLSFSDDGRMLASVGEDRTTCVWTTTDIAERTLNQHGQVSGLIVHSRDNKIIVSSVPDGSELQRDDQILAVVRGGEVVEVGTPKEFYKLVWSRRPGTEIEFTLRRNGELKSLKSKVGQAIDEAKPLFTLFVAPGERADDWEWIGWNPLGNFDLRGDRIDRWLGWHFNTDDPEHPAKFAPIGEYRDAFFRRDLLQTLVEFQKLPAAPVVEQEPKVSFWLRHQDGTPVSTDYENVFQLDSAFVEVVAEVSGVADTQIQGLSLTIDDAASVPLKKTDVGREWSADLSGIVFGRGTHRLNVLLRVPNRDVTATERLRFHPAAPTIDWEMNPEWKREVSSAEVAVKAKIVPTSEMVKVQLLLQRPGKDEPELLQSWESREPLEIGETVTIEPGENRLEIIAWNSSAPLDTRNLETVRTSTFIRRSTPPMAPRITVNDVNVLSESGTPKALTAEGDIFRTPLPKLRMRGQITAQAPISRASLFVGESRSDLAGFQSNQGPQFAFDEIVTLEPGRQSVVIQSGVGNEQDEKRLTFVYEPPTPQLANLTANVRSLQELPKTVNPEPFVFFEKYHEPLATVSAVIEGQLQHAYRVTIRVNETVMNEDTVKIDRSTDGRHVVTATVPVQGGKNTLVVRVENEWARQPSSRTLEIDFRRPPEITEIQAEETLSDKPFDLSCRISSAIPIRSNRILIDNTDEISGSIEAVDGSQDEYLMRAEKIGLSQGEHVLKISATNDEGTTIEPRVHKVTIEKPAAKPPALSLVGPTTDAAVAVSSRRLEFEFIVDSAVPTTVQIKNRGTRLVEDVIPEKEVPIDGTKGNYALDLMEGVNDIELTAYSSGGFSEKRTMKVSYVPTAAVVEILSIDDQQPQLLNDGAGLFERSASKARVKLRGRVKTKDRVNPAQVMKARIWVNNFKLPTVDVALDRDDLTSGSFTTEITLSRAKDNEIKVEVYGDEGRVASELGCTNRLSINCEKPERRQDLYLVLLGTGSADGVREHVQAALQAKVKTKAEASQEMWESEAFSQIHVFDALNVHPVTAQHRLLNLIRTMNGNLKSASKSGPQAIVMVYFQGQILLTNDDFTFVTATAQVPSDKAITGKRLEANLTNTYGAHLIFVDLTQNTKNLTASDVWPKAPQLGIIISNWTGIGQQPVETQLISALEQTLPQIRVVRDLAKKIDQRYQLARKKFPEQIETVDRLQGLHDLRIGVLD